MRASRFFLWVTNMFSGVKTHYSSIEVTVKIGQQIYGPSESFRRFIVDALSQIVRERS